MALQVSNVAELVGALRAVENLTTALLFLDVADTLDECFGTERIRDSPLTLCISGRNADTSADSRSLQSFSHLAAGATLVSFFQFGSVERFGLVS